jgi:hypothetical protein
MAPPTLNDNLVGLFLWVSAVYGMVHATWKVLDHQMMTETKRAASECKKAQHKYEEQSIIAACQRETKGWEEKYDMLLASLARLLNAHLAKCRAEMVCHEVTKLAEIQRGIDAVKELTEQEADPRTQQYAGAKFYSDQYGPKTKISEMMKQEKTQNYIKKLNEDRKKKEADVQKLTAFDAIMKEANSSQLEEVLELVKPYKDLV